MKRQRFKFKLLAFFLFALFALLGAYGMHSIALYGNRWFTYAKNPRVRAQKQNVVPGDILDRSGVVLATSSVSEDGTVTRVYQSDEAARRAHCVPAAQRHHLRQRPRPGPHLRLCGCGDPRRGQGRYFSDYGLRQL